MRFLFDSSYFPSLEWTELRDSADVFLAYLFLTVTLFVNHVSADSLVFTVLGLPLLLFVPGYSILLALFPQCKREGYDDANDTATLGIGPLERMALSFGISLTIAPLVALVYSFFGVLLTQSSVTIGFAALSAAALAIGTFRRHRLPQSERYVPVVNQWLPSVGRHVEKRRNGPEIILNLALAVAILFAVSSFGYGILISNSGEQYTTLYLSTADEKNDLRASGYPSNLTENFDKLIIGVENHEGRTVDFHLIVQLQWLRGSEEASGDQRVVERWQVNQTSFTVADNETKRMTIPIDFQVSERNESMRLVYLLYRDDGGIPDNPTIEGAYRYTYLWLETVDETRADQSNSTTTLSNPYR